MGGGAFGKEEGGSLGPGVSRGDCGVRVGVVGCGSGGGSREVWRRGGVRVGGGMRRKVGG